MKTNLQEIKEDLIRELNEKKDNGILEPSNVELLSKLINNVETIKEAEAIAGLGIIYKRTGFHFDHRIETSFSVLSFLIEKRRYDVSMRQIQAHSNICEAMEI